MKIMHFTEAIDDALAQAMGEDKKIIMMGEDIHALRLTLFSRFGKDRVISTPISESAFLGTGVSAAMAGLRPIVDLYMVDFLGVAMDALLNHATKNYDFSGNNWKVPLVIRAGCGGGYGDGGQHEQSLWGWAAHLPNLNVVVPSNPADAGGLMLSAVQSEHPVLFLEHKLLSEVYRDYLGHGGRDTVQYNIPPAGEKGEVPEKWEPIPFGKLKVLREGTDITLVSLAVGVHRCMEVASILEKSGISAEVIDLRTVQPLDEENLIKSVEKTKAILVIDEDYKRFGLSGEISAILLEAGLVFKFGRVCTETVIPFSRKLEEDTLPNTEKITQLAYKVLK
ncbi:MAG: alpha-ketoacid dehydrogenase subunit beta [Promethearchaeota archaeon]